MSDLAMEIYEKTRLESDNALSVSPTIISKYRAAAEIASQALRLVAQQARVGQSIADLCAAGDAFIAERTASVFTRQKCERGVALPTCINVNGYAAHYSPEDPSVVLQNGDVVKIELGVHIDGYIATAAHTLLVASEPIREPVLGSSADCICAAYFVSELVLRMLRPGTRSEDLIEVVRSVAKAFHVRLVEGPVVMEMKRFVASYPGKTIDNDVEDLNVQSFVVGPDEVYAVNIRMTDGDGRVSEAAVKPTLLQRNVSKSYQLRLQSARAVYSDISSRFSVFPFNTR